MAIKRGKYSIWQISAGPSDQSYSHEFLNHSVALIGSGDAGPWRLGRSDEDFEGSFARRFATELSTGDILLLRTGLSTICAIGLIASDYKYLPQFDDVNGWDLQHGRRVRWCLLPERYDFGGPVFGAPPPRLSRVQSAAVVDYANRFIQSPPTDWQTQPLKRLPVEEKILETPPTELREIVAQVQDLLDLYWNLEAFGERPTEDEMIVHNVVPFLRALGWPIERIAVKWRNIDLCLFSNIRRIPEHCCYLVEVKRLGVGIEGALGQAIRYVAALGVQRDVVVTDGIRYRMYEASKDFAPVAYANLARLKRSSLELFERMRP